VKLPFTRSEYYLSYDLVKDPFPQDTVDEIVYLTPELNHRIIQIKSHIIESQDLLLITSSPGAGKTVLSGYIDSLKGPDWLIGLIRVRESMDIDTLALALLQQQFPDRSFEASKAVSQLHKLLESSEHNGKILVFIIDDAHKLPFETLQFILQLADIRYKESLFRIVLFADETINDSFEKTGLKELTSGVIHNIHIPSLSKEQTKAYIENRLTLSGLINKDPLTDKDIHNIYKISGGLPRGINLLTRQTMQDYAEAKATRPIFKQLLIGVVTIPVLLISVYLMISNIPKEERDVDSAITVVIPPERSLVKESSVEKPIVVVKPDQKPLQVKVTKMRGKPIVVVKPGKLPEEPKIEVVKPKQPLVVAKSPEKTLSLPVVDTQKLKGESEARDVEPLINDDGDLLALTTVNEEKKPEPKEIVVEKEEEKQIEEMIIEVAVVKLSKAEEEISQAIIEKDEPILPVMQQEKSISTNVGENIYNLEQVPEILSGIKGYDWLNQQAKKSYALQLVSASHIANVEKLLKGLSDVKDNMFGYVRYTPSGKPRYMLFYGNYPNSHTATAAVNDMPSKLQAIKPWPRKIAPIIREIEEAEARGFRISN